MLCEWSSANCESQFYQRFGIKSKRARIISKKFPEIKVLLNQGLTLEAVAKETEVSPITFAKKLKKDYDS